MKRKLLKAIICFTIYSSAFAGLFSKPFFESYAVSQQTQNAIDEAEEEKEELENALQEHEEDKEILENRKEGEEQKLNKLKQEYRAISSNLEAMEVQKELKQKEIDKIEEELKTAQELHAKQYEDMKKRIQYMYEKPSESLLSLFFYSFDFAEILNRIDLSVRIQEYDRVQLEKYAKSKEEIELRQQTLAQTQTELENLINDTKEQQGRLAILQVQSATTIKDYLNQIANTEIQIGNTEDALKVKSETLQRLYAQAQAEEEAERRKQAQDTSNRLQNAISSGSIKQEDSGIVYGELNLTQSEMEMLTAMIYCESRGEPYEGQLAVGHVIMNRVRSSKFPNSLEAVLRQGKQFEPAGSGRFDIVLTAYWEKIPGIIGQSEWNSCQKAAMVCVNSDSNVGESLFFRTHKPVPQLAENLEAAGVPYWIIGNHIFYYSWVNY